MTTILPFKTFAEEVGGHRVEVFVLVPPGASPHTWEMLPHQMKLMSRVDVYVKVGSGVEFESLWEERIPEFNSAMVVCNGSEGIALLRNGEGHLLGQETTPAGRADPHVWLSPRNAVRIVENISDCLISTDPAGESLYVANAQRYVQRLDSLDRQLQRDLFAVEKPIFVLHPAWGYFARDYGLRQISIEIEGKEISPRRVAAVVDMARKHGAKTVFASPHVNPEVAELVVDEFGGIVEYADPLSEDYISSLLVFSKLILRDNE